MSTTPVPMSHPATVVKNSDGTYSVRIQHTASGSVTTVDFTNVLFAETLANAYAAFLNGSAVIDAKVAQVVTDAKPALADAQADVKKLIAEAEVEAEKLINAAKTEARNLKVEASALYEETKNEAEKLLDDAKAEAAKLLHDVAVKIEPSKRTDQPSQAAVAAKAEEVISKPPVVEDEN